MNEMIVFKSEEFGEIRTSKTKDGEPLFCLSDICKALGLVNASSVKKGLQSGGLYTIEVTDCRINQYGKPYPLLVPLKFISEPNFYLCVFRSRKPEAIRFQNWVCSDVLPSIRRSGGYITIEPEDTDKTLIERSLCVIRGLLNRKDYLLTGLQVRLRRLLTVNKSLQRENNGLRSKAVYADKVLDSVSCFTTTQIAKELGITAKELNRYLCERRVQYRQSGQYLLYALFARRGFARSRTHGYHDEDGRYCTRLYLVWTEKGRQFIHSLFEEMTCWRATLLN